MNTFVNPYHFVPLPKNKSQQWINKDELGKSDSKNESAKGARHDRYMTDAGHFTGSITCTLEIVTPTVIGGKREPAKGKDQAQVIHPFELGGTPAIPASSLKGMISSLLEAASGSNMRVLSDQSLSRRMNAAEAFKNIGYLKKNPSGWVLKPLFIPNQTEDILALRSQAAKTYVKQIKTSGKFPYAGLSLGGKHSDKMPVHFADLAKGSQTGNAELEGFCQVENSTHRNNLETKAKSEGKRFKLGFVKALNVPDGGGFMKASNDKFLIHQSNLQEIKVSQNAIDNFEQLATERWLATEKDSAVKLPFVVIGRSYPKSLEGGKFRVEEFDLVYFSTQESKIDGVKTQIVDEISYSCIWRKGFKEKISERDVLVGVYRFFEAFDNEFLPYSPERKKLSPAEVLLGFVAEQGKGALESQFSDALKGRVLFTDAILQKSDKSSYLPAVTLKILSSPKLPSPNFYFKGANGSTSIRKIELNIRNHSPKGRKMYAHYPEVQIKEEPWKTRNNEFPNQKVNVRPIAVGHRFNFEIHFQNLSDSELSLLCYTLAPTSEFHHKIGMGKPLGLGTVKLDVGSIRLTDQKLKYSRSLPELWSDSSTYLVESPLEIIQQRSTQHKDFIFSKLGGNIHNAISALGSRTSTNGQFVQYPNTSKAVDQEKEIFTWFVNNEKATGSQRSQFLADITSPQSLPTLTKNG